MSSHRQLSRRDFLSATAMAGAVASAVPNILRAQATPAAGKSIKVALIGCGGRGNGALENHKNACAHLGLEMKLVATADAFVEKAKDTGKKYGLAEDRCFGGYDGYKKVCESDAEVVLLATSPNFRPVHFAAAVAAGKHVFMEKPVAVDPAGARKVIAVGEEAAKKKLSVVAGTQRRHQRSYLQNYAALQQGAIGKICGGAVYWCGGALWYKTRDAGESDASYMTRNWVSFTEMSGDHIVEQHVHNIDIANWFIGRLPVAAIGFGGRARRITGDQFDFFSVDFDYGEGLHIHSMCRQVNGTYGRVSEFFNGSEGTIWGGGRITGGKKVEVPEFEEFEGPYCQEHVDLLNSIAKGSAINEAKNVAESTLCAIMGRIAAYTGELVRMSEVLEDKSSPFYNLACSPSAEDFEKGTVKAPADDKPAIPGKG
jgi:myo-inositol 2-dehydrogenase / D-chiro-inositol 1-dehydrogenase